MTRTIGRRILLLGLALGVAYGTSLAQDTRVPETRIPFSKAELFGLGPVRTFEGPALREVAFPLGGIGTGMVSLGGRGNLRDWEIFNRPGKGVNLPFTFFALYCEPQGGAKSVRILEGPLQPPFTTGFGFRRDIVPGFPRLAKARFRGEYPFAAVELSDPALPLEMTLEAFNPLVPLDPEASGIPGTVLRFRVRNTGPVPVRITIAGSLANPVGYDGVGPLSGIGHEKFGQNVNALRREDLLRGLFMSSTKPQPGDPGFGTVALATTWPDVTYLTHWVRGDWWDDLQIFWDDFADDGRLKDPGDVSPSPDKRTDIGTLGLVASIEPGGEVVLPFVLAWHFPNVLNYFDIVPGQQGKILRNHYAERYPDAWAAATRLASDLQGLEKSSRLFRDAFYDSTLPPYVLDAVSSQASIIRTPTCLWLEGGQFFGFEGCADQGGCCPLNCSHVWNYEQSLAFLFPTLEQSIRRTDFLTNVRPDGGMTFRTSLPLGSGVLWDFKPAADGQMGRIINLYRDWQITGDTAFLKSVWPQAKKALEHAWTSWDADRDGLMEGEQHNTYDIEFYGPNSMMGSFYLGALLAGSKLAEAVGDKASARTYLALYEKGRLGYDRLLWNGEYYVQKYDQVMEKKYQYGEGCLSDQLLGQWLGMVAGLGRYLPADRLRSALRSIYRYNFLPDFRNFSNPQRTYALGDEKGLLLCSWPRGGRPPLPFVYSDEVWTGIEYQVASHLIMEGLLEEGLSVVKAVRDRYDGERRNPWDEVECGHHYARAMSSWGVLLALSGFSYSAPAGSMGFDPRLGAEDFKAFWSTGSGWGSFAQKASGRSLSLSLDLRAGGLALREFSFRVPPSLAGRKAASVKATAGGKPLRASFKQAGDRVSLRFASTAALAAGGPLAIEAGF